MTVFPSCGATSQGRGPGHGAAWRSAVRGDHSRTFHSTAVSTDQGPCSVSRSNSGRSHAPCASRVFARAGALAPKISECSDRPADPFQRARRQRMCIPDHASG
eukprot:scaffold4882_cov70-Phaeocystis_antarctica.AAC.9